MTLSDLSAFGSFISGLAVLVSLVFLYFQLRQIGAQVKQAEKNQMASIRQQRTARLVEMLATSTDAPFSQALLKGFAGAEDISETQLAQFRYGMLASFRNAEDSFYQHLDGLLSESAFESVRMELGNQLTSAGVRALWKRNRGSFASEFSAFMNGLMEATRVRLAPDLLAQWKSDVAQEKLLAH
jgi:hypothetical protein